jgi:hypothetical protein
VYNTKILFVNQQLQNGNNAELPANVTHLFQSNAFCAADHHHHRHHHHRHHHHQITAIQT